MKKLSHSPRIRNLQGDEATSRQGTTNKRTSIAAKGADSKSAIRFALAHLPMLDGNPGAVLKNSYAHAAILNQRC